MIARNTLVTATAAILVATVFLTASPARAQQDDQAELAIRVEKSIAMGKKALWGMQDKTTGAWPAHGRYATGPTALAVYALLSAGENPQDPRIEKALKFLIATPTEFTYSLGLRCYVWHLANRSTLGKYREQLKKEADILVNGTKNGSYGYTCKGNGDSSGDNSNSQYGLLGVWAAAADGSYDVPSWYWDKVLKHWVGSQAKDTGGWGYHGPGERHTMVAAGVASLYVCYDYSGMADDNPGKRFKPIQKGLDWFDKNFAIGQHPYYLLYGIERVGLAAGYKYFGTHDWYKVGATWLLNQQNKQSGVWAGRFGPTASTSFGLLFLIRGRHPVLFNKLEHGGDWDRRSRDLAAVTRWISYNFETEVNWQIIDTKHPVSEWHDASILYITGTTDPKFTEKDLAKIKQFVMQGGMIFTVVQSGGASFNRAMQAAYAKMFNYSMMPIGKDHVLNHIYFDIAKPAKMSEITNGARPLVVHCDEDLAKTWMSARATRTKTQREYEIAFNVTMYGVDKMSALPPRAALFWPKAKEAPSESISITQVQHGGNWNPEPTALPRFADRMAYYEDVGVTITGQTGIGALGSSTEKIAVMTGAGQVSFSDSDAQAVRKYVMGGGTLVIDAAGGNKEFAASVESMLSRAFGPPNYQLSRLALSADIYGLEGRAINHCYFRRTTGSRLPDRDPQLKAILVGSGRPGVIFSDLDLTCGLAGMRSGGIFGYAPETSFDLMRNIIISTSLVKAAPAVYRAAPNVRLRAATGSGAKKKDAKTPAPGKDKEW